ncbi:MAG: hypothetical protein HY897_11110, partial [Deltaproteobacteria bacterium]|nr:hypothetical protein [Deltaproteobacteria bacterium]
MRHAAPALLALALLPVLAGCWIADFGELFNPDRCADEGDECGDGVPCCEGEGSCNYYASPPKCRRGIQYPYDNYDGYCGATGDRCSIDGNEGVCFDLKGGGVTECFATCANPGFECKISGTCYYTGFVEPFLCLPPGYKVPGEWCGAANECVAGATCLSYDGAVICFEVCNDANPCEEGSECTDTGLGFLVCVGLWDDRNGCVSLGGNCLFETCCEGFVCDYDTDLCVSLKTQLGDECRGDSWCASGQTCFQPKGVSVPGYCTLACSSDRQCDSETDVACCNDGLCQFVAGDTCGGRSGAIGSACTSGGNSDCSPGLFCDGTRFVDGRFAEGAYCTAYCADRNDCGPADHPVSGCM